MKCQEVIQFMQRDLDGDLNKDEQKQMLDHIESCHSCTEMFDRLKNVSNELEQLPKVTPPISLVDQILPQLDEIDQANASHNDKDDEIEKAEVVSTDGDDKKITLATFAKKSGPRFAFLGASAAAVILIVIIAINPPGSSFEKMRMAEEAAPAESPTAAEESKRFLDAGEITESEATTEAADEMAFQFSEEDSATSNEISENETEIPLVSEDIQLKGDKYFSLTKSLQVVSPNGEYMINTQDTESGGQELIVQKVENEEVLFTLEIGENLTIVQLEWADDNQTILLNTSDGNVSSQKQINIFNP
ncbi:anti-sigma factor family protein [Chengkuizengella axinellae]|uniref:Zf-HC2 domain-containing protein n=1 Tax=Chengkuizengella axinellae TaxID=3064388 RepID=A0ABT9IUR1_9BACL|nr:zf-HC2 domain-containing protein [Chengkuizengella sp. 2205SS18-9]MDP5273052.1 zf-HC2 domain-containing protein [Chengkuizengella sp. 2205SS18-9]